MCQPGSHGAKVVNRSLGTQLESSGWQPCSIVPWIFCRLGDLGTSNGSSLFLLAVLIVNIGSRQKTFSPDLTSAKPKSTRTPLSRFTSYRKFLFVISFAKDASNDDKRRLDVSMNDSMLMHCSKGLE